MKVKVITDGKEYISAEEPDGANVEEISENHYKMASDMDKFRMELEDGSFMVCGEEAVKKAIFIYIP